MDSEPLLLGSWNLVWDKFLTIMWNVVCGLEFQM